VSPWADQAQPWTPGGLRGTLASRNMLREMFRSRGEMKKAM